MEQLSEGFPRLFLSHQTRADQKGIESEGLKLGNLFRRLDSTGADQDGTCALFLGKSSRDFEIDRERV